MSQLDTLNKLSIVYDDCLEWYHYKCVGLVKESKTSKWFCCHHYA